ncbi:hypothetical protein PBRA_006119 [Plasmodiophora brassicae]|nr:hypothetical protein PBRA_006119 [Plasmodiophora brassicae]
MSSLRRRVVDRWRLFLPPLLAVLLAMMATPPRRTDAPGFASGRAQIVLVGDSITQQGTRPGGIHCLLADRYRRKADVINRGYSGYNSRHMKVLIERHKAAGSWAFAHHPTLFTLWLGANDAVLPSEPQHVPVDEYRGNLVDLVDLIADRRRTGRGDFLVLLTPPPIDNAAYDADCIRKGYSAGTRSLDGVRPYVDACLEVGRLCNVPVIDVFQAMLAAPNWTAFLSDGLHLSPAGYEFVYGLLCDVISGAVPQLDAERLPLDAPVHRHIRLGHEDPWADADPYESV